MRYVYNFIVTTVLSSNVKHFFFSLGEKSHASGHVKEDARTGFHHYCFLISSMIVRNAFETANVS